MTLYLRSAEKETKMDIINHNCNKCNAPCGCRPCDQPDVPGEQAVWAFGSLRGGRAETPGTSLTPVPFNTTGPLSDTISVSASGNELVVLESGVYQITVSINAETTTEPDPEQPYLTAVITVNGAPVFGDISTFFNISNRDSSTFVIQAPLSAGDEVGVSIYTNFPALGYMNRSMTLVRLGSEMLNK